MVPNASTWAGRCRSCFDRPSRGVAWSNVSPDIASVELHLADKALIDGETDAFRGRCGRCALCLARFCTDSGGFSPVGTVFPRAIVLAILSGRKPLPVDCELDWLPGLLVQYSGWSGDGNRMAIRHGISEVRLSLAKV